MNKNNKDKNMEVAAIHAQILRRESLELEGIPDWRFDDGRDELV